MLKKVLQIMSKGEVHSYADLARQLDVSEDLLARMMEDLANKGYLTPLATSEEHARGGCSGCPLRKACNGNPSGKATVPQGWGLTAKGCAAAATLAID
jgi:hypothetical protein